MIKIEIQGYGMLRELGEGLIVELQEGCSISQIKDILISRIGKEKEALTYVAKGFSFKEIADILGVSSSAIEKRIQPLYKRFNVKNLTHLVSFAYENHILP